MLAARCSNAQKCDADCIEEQRRLPLTQYSNKDEVFSQTVRKKWNYIYLGLQFGKILCESNKTFGKTVTTLKYAWDKKS